MHGSAALCRVGAAVQCSAWQGKQGRAGQSSAWQGTAVQGSGRFAVQQNAVQVSTGQCCAGQCSAVQRSSGQGEAANAVHRCAVQCKAGQGRAGQGRAGKLSAVQCSAGLGGAAHSMAVQCGTGQSRAARVQCKARHCWPKQHANIHACIHTHACMHVYMHTYIRYNRCLSHGSLSLPIGGYWAVGPQRYPTPYLKHPERIGEGKLQRQTRQWWWGGGGRGRQVGQVTGSAHKPVQADSGCSELLRGGWRVVGSGAWRPGSGRRPPICRNLNPMPTRLPGYPSRSPVDQRNCRL